MAKDPAFLFYPGDWQGGTSTFSRFLKGCYMDVLIAQFNSGPLSLEEIKTVLGSDFGTSWPTLQKKFKRDGECFFNERLEAEKRKRQDFSQSRRDNISKRYSKSTHEHTSVEHMNIHMENENRNKDEIKIENNKGGAGGKRDAAISVFLPFEDVDFVLSWKVWKQYLSDEHKKGYNSFSSEQAELKRLSGLSGMDKNKAIHLIEYSMGGKYKRIYDDKDYGKQQINNGQPKGNKSYNSNGLSELYKSSLKPD